MVSICENSFPLKIPTRAEGSKLGSKHQFFLIIIGWLGSARKGPGSLEPKFLGFDVFFKKVQYSLSCPYTIMEQSIQDNIQQKVEIIILFMFNIITFDHNLVQCIIYHKKNFLGLVNSFR